jgi:membrane-associated phospholipid phosphatase
MTHNDRIRETGRMGLEALAHTYLVTQALKYVSGRERPEDANGRGAFFRNARSFPSGHSMMTWSLATVIAHEYPNRKAVRYGAYAFALAVNAGRMTAQKHYAADSLVGGVFGYLIGTYLYEKHHNRELDGPYATPRTSKIPDIVPDFDRVSRNYGVALSWQW